MEQGLHYLWNKYLKCLCYEGVHDERFIGSVVFVICNNDDDDDDDDDDWWFFCSKNQ